MPKERKEKKSLRFSAIITGASRSLEEPRGAPKEAARRDMPKHDFEGVSVSILKQYFGISVAICNYIHTCAEKKRKKDYTFRRQFNEKPSIIPGCPVCMRIVMCS